MRNKKYGINSITDAFLALNDVLDEEIKVNNLKQRSKLKEAATVDVNNIDDIDAAEKFRKSDTKEEDSELEVIDVDADAVDQLKDGKSYIGKMLLQCNSCKATRFLDPDKLKADENDDELYNTEDECPHCHNTGTGYTLIGQVGKKTDETSDEASLDNDTNSDEEAMFDNTDEVEPEAEENSEENSEEDNSNSEDAESNDEETNYDETDSNDDTNDLDLPKLGDEFDVDDVTEDDTEEESDDEDKKKVKKESLNEDMDSTFVITFKYDGSREERECLSSYDEAVARFEEMCEDEDLKYAFLEETGYDSDGEEYYNEIDSYERENKNESLDEKLDMATFEGSIANLIDTFTIEDNPVNIKLLNKNGSELGMYSSDDLPFSVKSQMMDTFNTDDNYLEINVTEEGSDESTTVNDLFNYYRPDEDSQTTFVVTNVDTDEEEDFEELAEFLEQYGDYYIDGALGLRTLNIYIADGDLETEVEPLDDEEIEELGKENAEKEEAEVTEESLIEEIINSYPGLKLNRINNSLSEEYFIADSIRLNEDIDLVYKNFVKPTNNEKLIEHFKSYTGYEDEVDKFLKEHNISKDKYNKMLNESADKIYTIGDKSYVLYKDSYGNYKLDDKKSRNRVADWDSYDEAMTDIKKWIKAGKIIDPTDKVNEDVVTNASADWEIPHTKEDFAKYVGNDCFVILNDGTVLEGIVKASKLYPGKYTMQYDEDNWYKLDTKDIHKIIKYSDWRALPDDKKIVDKDTYRLPDEYIKALKAEKKEPENEKLLTSVKTRAELGEAINKLVNAKQKYHIKKSVNEGYRYDVFVNEDFNEGLFDGEDVDDEIEVLDDGDAEAVETELVDQTPSTEVNEPVETTDVVPADMRPEDREIVEKINRIATDISNAIQDTYNIEAPKNLIVADIIQDLQLIGGEKVVDDLENTPINQVTKQMYQEFNGFYDALDEMTSVFTGEKITTSQADKLAQAIASLDSNQFSAETIREKVASPQFIEAAKAGYIPFIDPTLLNAPTDESLRTFDEDYNTEDRLAQLKKIQKERKLTDDEAEELAYCENEVDSRRAEQNYLNGVDEDLELNDDNTSDEDCEQRLSELLYLQDQRELTPEEQEELDYCQKRVANKLDELDLESFDNCINEYLNESEDNAFLYRSINVEKLDEGLLVKGIIEGLSKDQDIEFTLKESLTEDASNTRKFTVTNNINDLKFNLDM